MYYRCTIDVAVMYLCWDSIGRRAWTTIRKMPAAAVWSDADANFGQHSQTGGAGNNKKEENNNERHKDKTQKNKETQKTQKQGTPKNRNNKNMGK